MSPPQIKNTRYLGRLIACVALLAIAGIIFYVNSSKHERVTNLGQLGTPQEADGEASGKQSGKVESEDDDAFGGLAATGHLPIQPAEWSKIDNPADDGWDSEILHERASQQLQKLGKLILGELPFSQTTIRQICHADCKIQGGLIPKQLERVYTSPELQVERWPGAKGSLKEEGKKLTFDSALAAAGDFWGELKLPRFELKTFGLQRDSKRNTVFETQQYIVLSGQADSRFVEQHLTTSVRWELNPKTQEPQMRSLKLIDFEQTTSTTGERLFTDCSASVLGQNDCYRSQLLLGLNHWLQRNQDMRYFSPLGNPGLAIGDVDGDGLDDLYVCQESHLPNRLFLQQSDGTAVEVSAQWKVDWLESTRSALLIDIDNDGDQDLAAAILGGLVVASNEGDHFQIRDVLPTNDDTTSLAAADFDADGDLDIYVCVDYPDDHFGIDSNSTATRLQVGAASRVYHDANTAGRNSLFRNECRGSVWSFRDVTVETGMDQNNRRFTWSASWEDFDNDGDQDLYVANDFGRNNLYRNDNGRFTDVAAETQAEDSASGMSVAWSDFDRDGWMDIYVANMFSSAGSRVSYQPQFKPGASQDIRKRLQRFARGSTLLRNAMTSVERFDDVSLKANVNLGRWAWSSNFMDINNDGWQDLVVANGYITTDDTSDL